MFNKQNFIIMIKTERTKKELLGGVHYTTAHTGKMVGVTSLSTSNIVNSLCNKRKANVNTICSHCFADSLLRLRPTMQEPLKQNSIILHSRILEDEEIPTISTMLFRGQSFGDSENWMFFANFFKIARMNPDVKCAVWTKNPWHIAECIERGFKKPKNVQVIYSSIFLNVCNAKALDRYPFVDKIFSVYDPATISEKNVQINCGSRSCLKCQLCYKKSQTRFVNEKLK